MTNWEFGVACVSIVLAFIVGFGFGMKHEASKQPDFSGVTVGPAPPNCNCQPSATVSLLDLSACPVINLWGLCEGEGTAVTDINIECRKYEETTE
jgi:hypothetical protein